jgi:hypothetical protein
MARVWGLTADEYVRRHGGHAGDRCADERGVPFCINSPEPGKYTWLRGRGEFGRADPGVSLPLRCQGPCRIPRHHGDRAPPPHRVDWAELDRLAERLYSRRQHLLVPRAASLPSARPGLLVVGTVEGDTPATELVYAAEPDPVDRRVALYYRLTDRAAASPGAAAAWLASTHPAISACGLQTWLWRPPAGAKLGPIAGGPPDQRVGAATNAGLGQPGTRAAYAAAKQYSKAYAAAWDVTPRASVAKWLDLYDNVVAIQWVDFDPLRLRGCRVARDSIDSVLMFLTPDGLPPSAQLTKVEPTAARASAAAPAAAAAPKAAPSRLRNLAGKGLKIAAGAVIGAGATAAATAALNRLTRPATPAAPPTAAPPTAAPPTAAAPPAAPPAGARPGGPTIVGSNNILNTGTINIGPITLVIGGGEFRPDRAGRPTARRDRRPWSWWAKASIENMGDFDRENGMEMLDMMSTTERQEADRWLINQRGLTFATGMGADEYVAAATPDGRRQFDGAMPTSGGHDVSEFPAPEWGQRIPYAVAPVATLFCLDREARRAFVERVQD